MTPVPAWRTDGATADPASERARFEAGTLDPAGFDHVAHVRVAWSMSDCAFEEALARYARGLRLLCARVGRPEKYHATVTVAFLALVAERRAHDTSETWEEFAARNPDLLDSRCLQRWYDAETLALPLARRTFLLPRATPRGAETR